jgi:CPW-WPC domain-containing protein
MTATSLASLRCVALLLGASLAEAINLPLQRHLGQDDIATDAADDLQKALDEATNLFQGSQPQQQQLLSRHGSVSSSKLPAMSTQIKESLAHLMNAQMSFNRASSKDKTEAEKALEKDIASAMKKATPTVGHPELPKPRAKPLTCIPDHSRCPQNWDTHGTSLCVAGASYSGPCKSPVSLTGMGTEERLAFARYCGVEFHCQEDCAQDFEEVCPSLWRQIAAGVCEAPRNYIGQCQRRIDVSNLTAADKSHFALTCGARWACLPPASHKYADVCPETWSLKRKQVCAAPNGYSGPCASRVGMSGMSLADKQRFEVKCDVTWPKAHVCKRDYTAACPFGWKNVKKSGDIIECIAPHWYTRCSRVQRFGHMTPDQKQSWEGVCSQRFPCRSRTSCAKDWAAVCPADWFAFNGGFSCRAPGSYAGSCDPVLDGVANLTPAEKADLSSRCNVTWPCEGESEFQTPTVAESGSSPTVVRLNGPVDAHTGRVRAGSE